MLVSVFTSEGWFDISSILFECLDLSIYNHQSCVCARACVRVHVCVSVCVCACVNAIKVGLMELRIEMPFNHNKHSSEPSVSLYICRHMCIRIYEHDRMHI